MSDHRRRAVLRLYPRRSRVFALLLFAAHGAAASVALALPVERSLRWLLLLLVGLSLAYQLWARLLARAPWSLRGATWAEDGWRLDFSNGSTESASLLPSTLVTRNLVILNFRVSALRYHSLLLTAGSIGPDALRRLRARLRLEHGKL
jgi:hypothetical protein